VIIRSGPLPPSAADSRSSEGAPIRPRRTEIVEALGASFLSVVMLGALYLLPYLVRDLHMPLGFDVPYYTTLANAASVERVSELGTIRVASGLLVAELMRATGQNALTLIAWFPALVTACAGLAIAAMARAALGLRSRWFPVIAFVSWAAFGVNTMVTLHLDNLLNSAMILAGFAAAVMVVAHGRGAAAATIFFIVAGLTHWPFYLFGMAVYLIAVLAFTGPGIVGRLTAGGGDHGPVLRLFAPAALSGAVVAAPFLLVSSTRRAGLRLHSQVLRVRFLHRLRQWFRYPAFPLAVIGVIGTARTRVRPERHPAKRFFLILLASWFGVSVLASIAQMVGLPTAGARIFSYLFPVTIFAALCVWWLVGLATRMRARTAGRLLGAIVVLVGVGGFGLLTWSLEIPLRPRVLAQTVAQISAGADYAAHVAPTRPIVFLVEHSRERSFVQASVRPEVLPRTSHRVGSPAAYLASIPSETNGGGEPLAFVTQRLNEQAFAALSEVHPERVVAPGVFLLRGPVRLGPFPIRPAPSVSTSLGHLVWVVLLVAAILFMTGGGWSRWLLPADGPIAVAMAPAFGMAGLVLGALAWTLAGFHLSRWAGLVPMVIVAAAGWALSLVRAGERAPA
jgi:hypothetical protein